MENLQPKSDDNAPEIVIDSESLAAGELTDAEVDRLLDQDDLDSFRAVSGIVKGLMAGLVLWLIFVAILVASF